MASLGQLVTRVANDRTDDIEKYLEIYNTKIEENKSGLGSIKKCSSRIKLLSSKTQRGRIRQECNILKCFPGTKCTFSILQGFITKTSNITLLQRNKYSFQAKGSKKQEKNDIGQIVAVASLDIHLGFVSLLMLTFGQIDWTWTKRHRQYNSSKPEVSVVCFSFFLTILLL